MIPDVSAGSGGCRTALTVSRPVWPVWVRNLWNLASTAPFRPRTSLKAALLDQTVVAGLGNIYTDEALFDSRLNPARPAGSLSPEEAGRLGRAIIRVLSQAVLCQGTTLRDYVNGWNRKGTFQDCLMVYGRSGQPCRHCGCIVQSRRLSGRTTCWCPSCQPDINLCEVTGHAAP